MCISALLGGCNFFSFLFVFFMLFYREKIMTTPRKEKKREARREEKAEKAAILDKVCMFLKCNFLLLFSFFFLFSFFGGVGFVNFDFWSGWGKNNLAHVLTIYRVSKRNCLNGLSEMFMVTSIIFLSKNTTKFLIWKQCRLSVKMKMRSKIWKAYILPIFNFFNFLSFFLW